MPPVGHSAPLHPSQSTPSDPNTPGSAGRSAKDHVSAEPSPAIISSSSNVTAHILARRFLGPMPENIINSTDVVEKRRRVQEMRRKAIGKLLGDSQDLGTFGTTDARKGVRKVVHRIRVRRRNKHGVEVEEEVELQDSGDDDVEEGGNEGMGRLHFKKPKTKKRKDVWIGDSFDVGQEYQIPSGARTPDGGSIECLSGEALEDRMEDGSDAGSHNGRPAPSRGTTQETFVTARSQPNDSTSMIVNLEHDEDTSSPPLLQDEPMPSNSSTISAPARNMRDSQGSSIQPLISPISQSNISERADQITPVKRLPGLKNRFRSAIKQTPGGSTELNSITSPTEVQTEPARGRSKSVQFHVDPVTQGGGGREPPRKGNKQPADPMQVLEREGSAVAGTSAGAVEEAEEEQAEEPVRAGQIIMRDRMLVRVGFHAKDGIGLVNEQTLRRDPPQRLDHFEEYLAVWRKGRVELYQDYKTPLKGRLTGHKQLCWTIALQPNRTSLSIFNPVDMTIALATSASRLDKDVDRILKSRTTFHGALKERVKSSRQYQWLQRFGRHGSHVFIMKISERTRAADWFWELWRDLGGELPQRLDIQIPALSTSVRLMIPEDEDEVGGRQTLEVLNPKTVVDTCWEMLEGVYDRDKLVKDTDVGLAWKSENGRLDWLTYDTTVQGRRRDWGVLVGLARQNIHTPVELQARKARHQPIWAKLEDGTIAQEPPGIEGYLIRQKTATAPKDHVYISTHDGNVFTSSEANAHPPLQPGKERSLPRDVFGDLHEAHLDSERERMAVFLQHSAGCIDFRDLDSIRLVSPRPATEGKPGKDERSFEVQLKEGVVVRFEAYSPEVAKEWVEGLSRLSEYWKRRHRIDARQRMEAVKVQSSAAAFTNSDLTNGSDELLADIWDWCPLKGCRPITYAGRIFMKKSPYEKYRLRYIVLSGGTLITFKIKKKQAYHERKKIYSLFASYCYSGRLAQDELLANAEGQGDAFASHPRVYHDGLQSSDGIEDTTFCLRLPGTQKWGGASAYSWTTGPAVAKSLIPPLSKKAPALLFFRARSSLERDRWVWAINAEKERMVRSHVELEDRMRNHDKVPED